MLTKAARYEREMINFITEKTRLAPGQSNFNIKPEFTPSICFK